MMYQTIKNELAAVVASEYGAKIGAEEFDVSYAADPKFGDFATNVAMVLAAQLSRKPREIAETISAALTSRLPEASQVTVAGPGFINIRLNDDALMRLAGKAASLELDLYAGQTIVTEYSDPNPFKAMHVGHLYTTIVGDVISRLYEVAGAKVHRLNYGGDVGLHVGRAMWGIIEYLGGEYPEKLADIKESERPHWISRRYVEGHRAYETDKKAKQAIIDCNKRVYELHEQGDRTSSFAKIYWTCREWSYVGFRQLYDRLDIAPFERFIAESEVTPTARELVRKGHEMEVFQESDKALVYRGEVDGLHTRVFLTSNGLPTYEAKDMGLAALKWREYQFDRSVIITADEIIEYMKVVLAALTHFYPEVVPRTTHLTHGMVKLPGGVKMSSRQGTVLMAGDILDAAAEANQKLTGKEDWTVVVGAVKYSLLRSRLGGDIVYNPAESVSLEGNSGPYLQYAHARARSILRKAGELDSAPVSGELWLAERLLARKISEYPVIIEDAVRQLMPHHICGYLYGLSQEFNRFYEANRVIGDDRQALRLKLVEAYADVLQGGLEILGIRAPKQL